MTLGQTRSMKVSPANSAAAGSAEPYVVTRLIWLACSSCAGGTRFGTVASLAGPHTTLTSSTSTVTTKTHHNVPTAGMETNSAARMKSPTTNVVRRSSRSATYPANGPTSSGGSTLRNSTVAIA